MKKIVLAVVLASLALFPTACTKTILTPSLSLSPTPTPFQGSCGLANGTAAQAVNLLGFDLYAALRAQPGNLFFSPFSIETAMAMAQEGANGLTACQMQDGLYLNGVASARQAGFQQLLTEINNPSKNYTLNTANDLWPQVGFNILPSYVSVLQNSYLAGVTAVDYVQNPAGALSTINGAVSQQTQGYIPNLLSPANINNGTRLVLTNAVYFKGNWDTEFPATLTGPQSFFLDSGGSETVSMMHRSFYGTVGNFNGAASVVALPYKNSEASMYIFLPPPGGMAALESALTGANIQSWLAANSAAMTTTASWMKVNLAMPKFTFDAKYDLTQTLAQSMPLAFGISSNGTVTDFSGIDGYKDLSITSVVHQAHVGVDETGTVAAAGTGVGVGITVVIMPVLFTADHPFIFAIVENTSNVVLFVGRVSDPLLTN